MNDYQVTHLAKFNPDNRKKKAMKQKTKRIVIPKVYLGDEEIKDNDIKAIILLVTAIEISTPRMRKANFDFVLSSPRIKKLMK